MIVRSLFLPLPSCSARLRCFSHVDLKNQTLIQISIILNNQTGICCIVGNESNDFSSSPPAAFLKCKDFITKTHRQRTLYSNRRSNAACYVMFSQLFCNDSNEVFVFFPKNG